MPFPKKDFHVRRSRPGGVDSLQGFVRGRYVGEWSLEKIVRLMADEKKIELTK